jgi:hypothetical protein
MRINKLLDNSRNLFKNDSWNGMLLFWGLTTFYPVAVNTSRIIGVSSIYGRGDDGVYNRLIWAKDYHNCLLAALLACILISAFKT